MIRFLFCIAMAVAVAGCGAGDDEVDGDAGSGGGGTGGAGHGGEAGGGTGGDLPELPAVVTSLDATTDRLDVVELTWELGEGTTPPVLLVYRDGAVLAEVDGTTTSFRDESASAPIVGEVELSARGRPGAIAFEWALPLSDGPAHVYVIETPDSGTSPEATGRRVAPTVASIVFSREAGDATEIEPGTGGLVEPVSGGSIATPILEADPSRTQIALRWDAPATEAPPAATYGIEFHLSDGSRKSAAIEARAAAPAIQSYSIHRDGRPLASQLGAEDGSFRDPVALPGTIEPPSLTAIAGPEGVSLSWEAPVVRPGAAHVYTLEVFATGGLSERSAEVTSSRLPPVVDAVELRRDGARVATFDNPGPTSWLDEGAEAGTVSMGTLSAQGTADHVELSWGDPLPVAGRQHSYSLHALSLGEPILASAPVTGSRQAPAISSFTILRGGVEVGSLPAGARSFADSGATPPMLGLPFLLANHRARTDGVLLRWAPGPHRIVPHSFQVRVETTAGPGGTASVDGARTPVSVAYEFQRDGGEWRPLVGTPSQEEEDFLTYLDTDSPLGTIAMTATVTTHPVLWYVDFNASQPVVTAPQPSIYSVRAVSGSVVGTPSDWVSAGRSVGGTPQLRWQRSAAPAEGDYIDLSHTSRSGTDDEIFDTPRWYRLRATTAGAEGYSNAVASSPDTFVDIAASNNFTCGIRSSDGKRRCWGSDAQGQAPLLPSTESFDEITAGGDFGCGIRSDDGKVVCWGNTALGVPSQPTAASYRALDAGPRFVCGIRADDGRIDCWGDTSGRVPPASLTDSFDDLALGNAHVCAIRRGDGKVLCWGSNTSQQAPAGPSDVAYLQIDAGLLHTCAVRADNSQVDCWGSNLYGESSPPAPFPAMARVDLGHRHSCGVAQADGKVICWGGVPEFTPAFMTWTGHAYDKTAGGYAHTCAIRRSDGRVTCIGDRNSQNGEAPRPFDP